MTATSGQPGAGHRRLRAVGLLGAIAALALTSCTTTADVTAISADAAGRTTPADAPPLDDDIARNDTDDIESGAGTGGDEANGDGANGDETDTDSPAAEDDQPETQGPPPTLDPLAIDPDSVDFGDRKPSQPWDEFVLASATDVEAWLTAIFPDLYGIPFEPLEGGVYAAYPSREDDLPGCGEPTTSYRDVSQFAAFYCSLGDFIIYDDSPNGLLGQLATSFGPATIGIVIAHEYAHAVQQRIGALSRRLPTVVTEQQADCIAGAWAGRTFRGEVTPVPFSDSDVRAALIAMIEVEDPIGVDQLTPGGHGSGFDRVGAFQLGFQSGPAACVPLLDDPLPLTLNEFLSLDDQLAGGDAPFGYGEQELIGFLVSDLNLFWGDDLADRVPGFPDLRVTPVRSLADASCPEPLIGTDGTAAALCAPTADVFVIDPEAVALYNEFGDFSIGYSLGTLWSEMALRQLGNTTTGEARSLLADCLTGGWVYTVTPDVDNGFQLPQPRAENRTASISPGDLTEAIQLAILIGDDTIAADEIGFPFEKIDAFRLGALDGLDACGL